MSKAILVMDMPDSCMGCNFLYCDAESNSESCQAREKALVIDFEKVDKPDWCPLREMPEKKKETELRKVSDDEVWRVPLPENSGWNACIDAIGGGDE